MKIPKFIKKALSDKKIVKDAIKSGKPLSELEKEEDIKFYRTK